MMSALSRSAPQPSKITVQGDANTVQSLQSKELRAMVDLTGVSIARELRKRIEIAAPPGVTLLRVAPEEVLVIFPPDR